MMAKSKPSRNFQSYIGLDDNIGNGYDSESAVPLELSLLPGETPVAAADSVLLFLPMTERRQGVSGRLHVTTFRLSFVTLQDASAVPGRESNLLLGKHDVCLANVDCIYQLSSNGKRKLLQPRSNVTGRVKELQVRCKDFRVLTFSFKCTRVDEDRAITNALLLYCYPRRPHLIFAFDYKAEAPPPESESERLCCSAEGWEEALNATGSVGWRISHVNNQYAMCNSLPEVLVVPKAASEEAILAASSHYGGGRPPVWCWGHPDGAAIARAAATHPAGRHSRGEQAMVDAMRESHPGAKEPIRVDVGGTCPSVDEVQESYVRLRETCSPGSVREFVESDARFLGLLSASRWPWAVSRCLAAASDCVSLLNQHRTTVLLTEPGGRDLTAVVSCLAQLLVEPQCRTLAGFQRLVQREWVALGHPFQERAGLVLQDGGRKGPVFLLFLDCVHQLLWQFPARFEFTQTYLVSLWDATHVSVCDTFLFNSERERQLAIAGNESDYPLRPRSVWSWSALYSPQHRQLFTNALWELCPGAQAAAARARPAAAGYGLLAQLTRPAGAPPLPPPRRSRRPQDLLTPVTSAAAVRLWTLCYCRWVPSLDVAGGGAAAEEEVQRRLVAQLHTLQARLESVRAGVGVRQGRGSAAPQQPLPNAFHPYVPSRTPVPLLCVTPGLVNALVRSSIVAGDDDALAGHRARQHRL